MTLTQIWLAGCRGLRGVEPGGHHCAGRVDDSPGGVQQQHEPDTVAQEQCGNIIGNLHSCAERQNHRGIVRGQESLLERRLLRWRNQGAIHCGRSHTQFGSCMQSAHQSQSEQRGIPRLLDAPEHDMDACRRDSDLPRSDGELGRGRGGMRRSGGGWGGGDVLAVLEGDRALVEGGSGGATAGGLGTGARTDRLLPGGAGWIPDLRGQLAVLGQESALCSQHHGTERSGMGGCAMSGRGPLCLHRPTGHKPITCLVRSGSAWPVQQCIDCRQRHPAQLYLLPSWSLILASPIACVLLDLLACHACGADMTVCCMEMAGTYKPVIGSAICTDCEVGKYNTFVASASDCTRCTDGYFQDLQGATVCRSCGNDTSSNHSSNAYCTCNPGYSGLPDGFYDWSLLGVPPFAIEWRSPDYPSIIFKLAALCESCRSSQPRRCGIGDILQVNMSGPSLPVWNGLQAKTSYFTIVSLPIILDVIVNASGFRLHHKTDVLTSHGEHTELTFPFPNQTLYDAFGLSLSIVTTSSNRALSTALSFVSVALQGCSACSEGKYKTASSTLACTSCSGGKYLNVAGSTGPCSSCPSSTSSPDGAANVTDCSCNIGYSGSDARTCVACEIGKYKSISGSWPCANCSAGYYQELQGQSECTMCSAGSYQPMVQTSTCESCPPGKAGTITNSTSEADGCSIHCPPGYYSVKASTSCVDCPSDTYSWRYLTGPSCLACTSHSASKPR